MIKQQVKKNFSFIKGASSLIVPTFPSVNKGFKAKKYYEISDKERLHNDYRKSTLAIKEEFDKYDGKYAL